MVAIVAGQGLGLSNTSLGLLGAGGQLGVAGQGRSGEGVYVNASTGNLVVRQQDEWLVGVGPDAGVVRTYNSQGTGVDDNGDNWQLGLSRRIVGVSGPMNQIGSTVVRRGEDGVDETYTYNGVAYVSLDGGGAADSLTWDGFGNWLWRDGDTQALELYEIRDTTTKAARLMGVSDKSAQVMWLTYTGELLTRVDTSNGDYIEIAYETGTTVGGLSKTRNIKSVTTFYASGSDGSGGQASLKRVNYTYDEQNRLSQVIVDLSPADKDHTTGATYTTTYTYDGTSRRILTLTQSDGSQLAFTYEGDKVKTITDVRGSDVSRVSTFTYDTAAGKVSIQDALGQVTELFYETGAGQNQRQLKQVKLPPVNGTRPSTTFTYDKGNVTKVVDENNRETVYRYDLNGNRVYERNAQGNVIERVYSGTNLLLQEKSFTVNDPDGEGTLVHSGALTQRYVYDDAGKLRFVVSPTGNVTEYKYDGQGQRTSQLSYPADTFDVNVLNLMQADFTSGPGALGTLPAGFSITAGGKLQITSTNQTSSAWVGAATAYQLMGTTWKAEITLPATAAQANAHLLMQAGLEAGTMGSAAYRRHFVQISNGYFYTDVYNGTSVLAQRQLGPVKPGATYVLEILTSADGGTTLYIYEKGQERSTGFVDTRSLSNWTMGSNGLLAARLAIQGYSGPQSAGGTLGATVNTLVDNLSIDTKAVTALEQWASTRMAGVQRTDYHYDVRGQLDRQTAFGSVDASGNGVSDGSQAVTQYVYDQAGNLLQKIDGRAEQIVSSDSAWAQQARQAFGYAQYIAQLTEADKVALRGKYVTLYSYDGLNRITTSKDPGTGQTVYTAYADGTRQTLSLMPNGVISTSTYDQAGRLLTVSQADGGTMPLGTTSYTYDKLGRLTSVTYPTGVKRYFVYDAQGRKVGEIDGEGALTEYQYDAAGQPTRTTGYATKVSSTMITALLEGKASLSMNMVDSSVSTSAWIKAGNAVDTTPTTLLAGENSRTIEQAAGGAAGESNLTTTYLDVAEGKRYDVSAYTGALNATATLKVEFYNGTTQVGTTQVLGSNAAEKAGGTTLADYKRLQGFVTAPTGATKMRVIVVKSTSTNTAALSRLTITRPVVALADAAQTTASLLDLRPARSVVNDRISWNIYDDAGRLSKTVSATSLGGSTFLFGAVVEYRYDGAGRLLDTQQYSTQLIYTDMGKLTANGAQIKSGGDGLISVTSPTGATSTITLSKSTTEDRRTRYFYDANGRQVGVLDAENYYSESQYDNAGRLVRTTRYATALTQAVAEGATSVPQSYITTQFNDFAVGGQDQSTYYFYNAAGQLKTTIDAEQYVTAYEYDPSGNKFKETRYALTASSTNSAGAILLGTIPASKGVTSAALYVRTSANDRSTTFQYDGNQRLIRTEVQPSGLVSTFTYDEMGNLSATVVALGQSEERSTQKAYDKLGRVTHELSGVGSLKLAQATTPAAQQAVWNEYATRYEYAAAGGHLIAKITPNGVDGTGVKTVYYYDEAGRVTHSVNALGEVLGHVYNAFGDVTEQRRYAKRLASPASYGGGLKSAVATVMGNLVNATEDAVVLSTYTRQGLLATRQDEEGAIVQTAYNSFGQVAQTQWDNTLGTQYSMYTYERRGLLQLQQDFGSGNSMRWSGTLYDAFGRARLTYDRNGGTRNHYYDRLGRDLYLEEPNNPDIFVTLKHDAFGRISTFTDAQSQATTYTYNDAARTMTVTVGGVSTVTTYDHLGQSVQVSDGRGNVTKYNYDKDGRLTGTGIFTSTGTAVEGTASTTEYDKAGRVYKTTDERGIVTTVTYDKANRVLTRTINEGGLNLTSEYRYDALGNTAWSKDAAGVWTQTTFNRRGQVKLISVDPTQVPTGTVTEANPFGLVANPAGANALNLQTQFQYNADGSVYRVTKGLGSSRPEITEYRYDDLGRREKEILDPTGTPLTTTYTYDNADQVVARTDALGQVTRYVYNASGKVTHVIDATGAVVRTDYDVHGRVSRTVAYATAIPAASLSSLQITEAQINALLPATPNSTTDQITYNVYDARGQLTWSIDALGYATQREYDQSGNVARVTRYKNAPSTPGEVFQVEGHLTYTAPVWSVPANANDKVVDQYVYDEANRLSWHVDAMGYATQTQYTDSGRTITVTRYGKAVVYPGTQTLLTIGTQAPKVLTAVPSPVTEPYVLADSAQDHKTTTKLDAAGRVSTVTDALGNITLTEYDAAGRVKLVTVASNDVQQASKTQYVYDKAGRLVEETRGYGSADAATTRYVLDALGQRTAIIDPRGVELAEGSSAWAKAERYILIGTESAPAVGSDNYKLLLARYTTKQTFDAVGRLKTSTDALNGVTRTDYDAAGNVVKVTAPDGGVGYFAYNANNKATWHIDPMGYATQTFYNALGQVDKIVRYNVKVSGSIVAGQEPTAYANLAEVPNGVTFYQLKTSGKDAITQIAHDKLGRQTTITDAENNAETIAYDDYGNKKSFTNKLGYTYEYTHDALGRVLTETAPEKVKELDANGQIKLTGGQPTWVSVVTRFEYDARDNITKKIEGDGLVGQQRTTSYTYDLLDRLMTTTGEAMTIYSAVTGVETASQAPVETRLYDKRGNLTEVKAADGGRTLTYWDTLDRKVAEVSPTGTLTHWDYADDGKVVAQRIFGDVKTIGADVRGGTRPSAEDANNVRETLYTYDQNHRLVETKVTGVRVALSTISSEPTIHTSTVVTRLEYDSVGNVVKEVVGAIDGTTPGAVTYNYYDKLGNRTLQVDAERYVTQWTYDEAGNVKSQIRYAKALASTVSVTTSRPQGELLAAISTPTDNRTVEYDYDRMGRKVEERVKGVDYTKAEKINNVDVFTDLTNQVVTTKYQYNALGGVIKKTNELNQVTDMTYDKQGRLIKTQSPEFADGRGPANAPSNVRVTSEIEYNGLGQQLRTIQRGSNPDASIETDDHITVYTYGKNGVQVSVKDPAGALTTFKVDIMGRITRQSLARVDAAGVTTTDLNEFVYDLVGRQTKQSTRNTSGGETTTQETRYNTFGEITGKGTNGGWQEFAEYDKFGRVIKSNSGSGVAKAYLYDARGNATVSIESKGANLKDLTIDQILALSSTNMSVSVYNRLNQLVDTFQADMNAVRETVNYSTNSQGQSVYAGNNSIIQIAQQSTTGASESSTNPSGSGISGLYGPSGFIGGTGRIDFFNYTPNAGPAFVYLNSFPDTSAYGDGPLKVSFDWSFSPDEQGYPGSFSESKNVTNGEVTSTFNMIGPPYMPASGVRVVMTFYKTLPSGTFLYIGRREATNSYSEIGPINGAIDSRKRLVLKAEASSNVRVAYRRAGSSDDYTMLRGSPVTNTAGNAEPGMYEIDWAAFPAGALELILIHNQADGSVVAKRGGILGTTLWTRTLNIANSPGDSGYVPTSIGQPGRGILTSDGLINLTEQFKKVGSSNVLATELTLRYRVKNSGSEWTTVSSSTANNPLGLMRDTPLIGPIPGWFTLRQNAFALGTTYEFDIVSKSSTGDEITRARTEFSRDAAGKGAISAFMPYSKQNAVVTLNQATSTAYVDITYKTANTSNAPVTFRIYPTSPGVFSWDANALVPDPLSNYNYEVTFKAYAAGDLLSNHTTAVLRLGASPQISNAQVVATQTLRITPGQSGVNAIKLGYRLAGSNATFTSLSMASLHGEFRNDVAASIGLPVSGAVVYEYVYDMYDVNGKLLGQSIGTFTLQAASATVAGAASRLDWVVGLPVTSTNTIHRSQAFNAFGELISETDGRGYTTKYEYTTLGKQKLKEAPSTSITLANGNLQTDTPKTRSFYDALGRLVGVEDANQHRNNQILLADLNDGQERVLTEIHIDNGSKKLGYDAFGNLAYSIDELDRRTDYTYDASNRLTRVDRPERSSGVRAYDVYAYDAAGNRIKRTTTNDGTTLFIERTHYDALGRVTDTYSAHGAHIQYSYLYQPGILGVGNVAVGGWQKTTTDAVGRTQVDRMDLFGHLTSHTDMGGRQFTYTYDNAGWLRSQTSLGAGNSGQNIVYDYFDNGYIKSIWDKAIGTYTSYEYDAQGNRTFEGYVALKNPQDLSQGVNDYYQYATITYDELNRVKQVTDPSRFSISYEYDAVGNRRRVLSKYYDPITGAEAVQNYWYSYDKMNRFLITMGSMVNGVITRGPEGGDGVEIQYDAAGQRRVAIYAINNHREDYSYTAEGYLDTVTIDMNLNDSVAGKLASKRTNDLLGRVTKYQEFGSDGLTETYVRNSTYDKDNRTVAQSGTDGQTSYTYYTGTVDSVAQSSATGHGALAHVENVASGGGKTNTYYAYEYWDEAKQMAITNQAYDPSLKGNNRFWKPGFSQQIYDVNGHLSHAVDAGLDADLGTEDDRKLRYVTNAQGLILTRNELAAQAVHKRHVYYYLDGHRIGDVGNDGEHDPRIDYAQTLARRSENKTKDKEYRDWKPIASVDFDQNYEPINAAYPSGTPGSYTTRDGDNLERIAQALWGDGSLWYLLADANGLNGNVNLVAGQTLTIPNKVTNIHNNSSTYRVYNPGEAIGDVSPTIPTAPPPPSSGSCGSFLMVIVVVVAIVVTAIVAPQLVAYMVEALGPALGTTTAVTAAGVATTVPSALATAAGWAAAGAIGSVVSQGVAMAVGVQKNLSWKSVALSAIGSGVGAGLGSTFGPSLGSTVARGMTANVITQGIGVATGLQEKFDWRGVAAAGLGSALSYGITELIGQAQYADWDLRHQDAGVAAQIKGDTFNTFVRQAASGFANEAANAVVYKRRPDWASIAAQSFGSALGDSIVGSIQQADLERQHPVVTTEEKAQILAGFANGPQESVAGQGLQLRKAANGNGLALSSSNQDTFDKGIDDARLAREQAEKASVNDHIDAPSAEKKTNKAVENTSARSGDLAYGGRGKMHPPLAADVLNPKGKLDFAQGLGISPLARSTLVNPAFIEDAFPNGTIKVISNSPGVYMSATPAKDEGPSLRELAFKAWESDHEIKIGGGVYAGPGANGEVTLTANLSKWTFTATEGEWGVGAGVGGSVKFGWRLLEEAATGVNTPLTAYYKAGEGQAVGTGAVSIKVAAEVSIPRANITIGEMRVGGQSRINGMPSSVPTGGFYEVKIGEIKAAPTTTQLGATMKIDIFNNSYKRAKP